MYTRDWASFDSQTFPEVCPIVYINALHDFQPLLQNLGNFSKVLGKYIDKLVINFSGFQLFYSNYIHFKHDVLNYSSKIIP